MHGHCPHAAVGDFVNEDELLAEIETDKVSHCSIIIMYVMQEDLCITCTIPDMHDNNYDAVFVHACVLLTSTMTDHPVVIMTILRPQSDYDYNDNNYNYVHVTVPHCTCALL